MKKRLMLGLAASALMTAMVSGAASAETPDKPGSDSGKRSPNATTFNFSFYCESSGGGIGGGNAPAGQQGWRMSQMRRSGFCEPGEVQRLIWEKVDA